LLKSVSHCLARRRCSSGEWDRRRRAGMVMREVERLVPVGAVVC